MQKKVKYIALTILALGAAIGCFVASHFVEPSLIKIGLFGVGSLCVLGFFVGLSFYLDEALEKASTKYVFNISMLVVSFTFSMLFFYAFDITDYDIIGNEIIVTLFVYLLAFVFVVVCSIVLFRELRRYADSFYTACFTTAFAAISAFFYLFGDLLPSSETIDALRLFTVVSSLSLALSLLLIERDKRKQPRERLSD